MQTCEEWLYYHLWDYFGSVPFFAHSCLPLTKLGSWLLLQSFIPSWREQQFKNRTLEKSTKFWNPWINEKLPKKHFESNYCICLPTQHVPSLSAHSNAHDIVPRNPHYMFWVYVPVLDRNWNCTLQCRQTAIAAVECFICRDTALTFHNWVQC